ncbi:MAG: hypothetical protein ABJA32_06350 [Ginsengibacter sp.]
MKLFKICIVLFLFAGLASCENHMDINDIVKGTPTNADTVLPRSHHKSDVELPKKDLPRVYLR